MKLQPINPSYLKKLSEWQDFYETDLPASAMKYKLNFLVFVDVNLGAFSTLHG